MMELLFRYDGLASWCKAANCLRGLTGLSPICSHRGLLLFECKPQTRTILTQHTNTLSKRFAFPYILFAVSYSEVCYDKEKSYKYHGVYRTGLRVMFSNTPIKTLTDLVYEPPIEGIAGSLICTPHEYDHTEYRDLPSLVKTVIGLWWNVPHQIKSYEWAGLTQEQCLAHEWSKKQSLWKVLNSYTSYDNDPLRSFRVPLFPRIKRTPWPGKFAKSTLQPKLTGV